MTLLTAFLLGVALAQEPSSPAPTGALPVPDLSEPPAGAPVTDGQEVRDRTMALTVQMRCPVCQGLSVADSQTEAAVAMRTRVEEMVAAGYDDEQIVAWFVDRYGQWVMLEPPTSGVTWLVWLAPAAFVLAGAVVLARVLGKRTDPAPSGALPAPLASDDPFVRRTLDELERS